MKGDKKAVSFLEIIISLALISVVILGTSQVLQVGMMSVYKNNQDIIAFNLARGLMSEIMAKSFFDPQEPTITALGINTGEETTNKLTFDDVDDYNAYIEATPITIDGVSMIYYNGFSRSVTVDYVNQDMVVSGTPTDFKRVTVTVTAAGIANTVLAEVAVNL